MTTLTKPVTLSPGQSQQVSFQVTPQVAGVYSVSVDGLTGSFEATEVVGLATIEGQVTDYVNLLPNIRVLLSEYINTTWSFLYDTYTDASGSYRFIDIPCKKYRLFCDDPNYWAPGKDCVAAPGINTVDFRLTPLP